MEGARPRRRHPLAEARADNLRDLLDRQWANHDPPQPSERPLEIERRLSLTETLRSDQANRLPGQPPKGEADHTCRSRVQPLDVVDPDQKRRTRRSGPEHPCRGERNRELLHRPSARAAQEHLLKRRPLRPWEHGKLSVADASN